MIQSSERITCLAAWQSRSWDMKGREERNTSWNSMWGCTITAASFLMIIYGYIHYKHQAKPFHVCSRAMGCKEPVVHIQISRARRLETAVMPKCHIWLATKKVAPWLLICNHKVISVLPDINNCSCVSPKMTKSLCGFLRGSNLPSNRAAIYFFFF